MEKHKAIAIPVSFLEQPHFLLVHDRRYSEWTFVTGGCRRREVYNPLRCALRELEEETRGLVDIKSGSCSYFKFETPQKEFDEEYTAVYHVYIIDYPCTLEEQQTIVTRFNEEKHKMDTRKLSFRKQYDENDQIDFDTLEGIQKRLMWPLINESVIGNPEFYKKLTSDRYDFCIS